MSRYRHYLELDVLQAARERLDTIHALFDTAVVLFSGGKDSLVCLELMREYVPFSVVSRFAYPASREHVSVTPTKKTTWYQYRAGGGFSASGHSSRSNQDTCGSRASTCSPKNEGQASGPL